ncbi:MAG: Asp-tRNA(Asn)/Glu-tRNA(Gln) amidotransferase GatCAB subunit A [Planctomycetes bacterium]|nr:Asp-tRNA(Asn)/Glu-tRNA(Gln) amidotransferase GatCAB subunit A [Planctomycetota bacterium]
MQAFPAVATIAQDVRNGGRSARSFTDDALARIDAHGEALGAFLHVDVDGARAHADEVDRRAAGGDDLPLAGVPIALKDNLCTNGVPTTCGSRILSRFIPPYDATVVARLRAAGAVIVAKTNLDEFAMGSSNENSAFGPVRNPWDLARAPGGSSGGSAAAVAAGLVPVALGSDTGGSIRQPAALTGTVGLKPTYGRVSRYGLVAFGSSLDQIGPLSRNVEDAARVLAVIAGGDPRDATCSNDPVPDVVAGLEDGVDGLRVGLPREYFDDAIGDGVKTLVRRAANRLATAGATLIDVSLPHTSYGIPAYYIVATSEASSNLSRYDGIHYGHRTKDAADLAETYERSRTEGFGAEVRRRIMLGTFALASGYYDAYYDRAMRVRTLIRRDFEEAFEQVDVILSPTSPTPAFKLGEKTSDPLEMYLADVLTVTANLAGVPGLVVPEGLCDHDGARLPVGVQLMGPLWSEARLLQVGRWLERTREEAISIPEGAAS